MNQDIGPARPVPPKSNNQREPWMQLASGRAWPLLAPTPQHVHWPDIAVALAKVNRFNGHTAEDVVYSVAQHCCHVADSLFPEHRLYGLLHDAHEMVSGDPARPFKAALDRLGGGKALKNLTAIQDRAIFAAAGLPWPMPGDAAAAVKEADNAMLATERRDLLVPGPVPSEGFAWDPLPDPFPFVLRPWPWPRAADEWLERLRRWLPMIPAAAAPDGKTRGPAP